jgi:hypothetical protein
MSTSHLSALWSPIGDFRVQLAWRVFGFAMCQTVNGDKLWPQLGGALLIVLGPRSVTLLVASISGFLLLRSLLTYPVSAIASPAEEHLVFLVLPILASLISRMTRGDRSSANSAQIALLRLSGALLMLFVGFHKLNSDFFHDSISCAHALAAKLDRAWSLPLADLGVLPEPSVIVSMELGAALLLLVAPRIAILFTGALLTPIALFGPTSLVTTVMAFAMAGLSPGDGRVIVAGMKRYWYGFVLLWAALGAVVYYLYEAHTYLRILMFLWVMSTLLAFAGLSLAHDRKGASRQELLPRPGRARWLLVGFMLGALLNGFSPYLGIKTRMSFAMFSNLRVDEDRWNHYLVPKRVNLRAHDPFVRLDSVEWTAGRNPPARTPAKLRLVPALVSPQSLRRRVEFLASRRQDANLVVTYAGESHAFDHVATNREFRNWLEGLPDGKLFQRSLQRSGPQPCIH